MRTGKGPKASRTNRIHESIEDQPDLRQRFAQMGLREKELLQLRYLFDPTYPRIWDMICMLSEEAARDFVARLNLLIKDWDVSDARNRARIEVRMEDTITDFDRKLAEYNHAIAARDAGGQIVSFSDVVASEPAAIATRRVTLPVLGRAAAGVPKDMVQLEGEELQAADDHTIQPGDFIVVADGDSMSECGIHDGDYCVIHHTPEVDNGQIALVAIGDGSTIKRFYRDNGDVRLEPCSPDYPAQHYGPQDDVRVLGRFIKVVTPEA